MTRPRFRSGICVTLAVLIVFTGIPVSATEVTTAAPILGEVSGVGDVQVGGIQIDSANLTSGDHIRTGESSSAKLILLNGSRLELSSKADLTINSIGPEIRLQLMAGGISFEAPSSSAGASTGNRLAIAVGQYEILPEASASGSIAITASEAIKDGNQAALQVLTGNVKLYDSEEKSEVVVPAGTVQMALNIPPPSPGVPGQDLAQTPSVAQAPQEPPAQRPANLPTGEPDQQPPASRPKPGGKTLPIILGAGGGAALAGVLAAKGSSTAEASATCSPGTCPPAQPSPSISALTPNSASVGTPVTIIGSNFGSTQGTSSLRFSGIAAVVSSWSDTAIVATVPAGAASGSVVVITAAGTSSNGAAFTVNPPPSVTGLSLVSGPVGTLVAIEGTNFGASPANGSVTFSGIVATIVSWTATSIVAVVPNGAATGNVVVTTTTGGPSSGLPFTVIGSPALTTLTPGSGIVGSLVTITGSAFGATQGSSTVRFNGTTATSISSWSDTSIVAAVPAGSATGNVVVTTAAGASNGLPFSVVGSPALTTLTPTSGIVGTLVTIAGSAFGATQGTGTVKFNGITATSISSWSNSSIVAAVPAGSVSGNVVVTTIAGASNGLPFTVIGVPVLTTLNPGSGIVGTLVTITGSSFGATRGSSTVTFNGTAAVSISSWSDTSIAVVVPAGATSGNVVVTTAGGPSNGASFTVNSPPTITNLSPSNGLVGGTVTIAGTGFGATQGTSTVAFNGTTATSISSWSGTSITVVVPSGATSGSVVVTTVGGPSNGAIFTLNATTTITNLSPNSGVVGSTVTITGSGFGATPGTGTVTFNGTAASSFTGWTDTSIGAVVPAGATSGNVVVTTTAGGTSNGAFFTVNATTTITNLSPNSGVAGVTVTITGSAFGATQGTSTVTFDETPATSINSWSDTSIVAVVPFGTTTGNVVVTTAGGGPSNGAFFTVNPPTTITNLSPNSGIVGGTVTISGTGFGPTQGTSLVAFNGTAATSFSSWSDTSIVVVVPDGTTTGNVLILTTAGGSSNGMLFTVTGPPTLTSLTPNPAALSDIVTIVGSGFGTTQGAGTVTFNGTPATSISSWSDSSIAVAVPPGTTTGDVVVTTAAGASNGLFFFFIPRPVITSLTPDHGDAGTETRIAGYNFGTTQGSSTVSFDGTPAPATQTSSWSDGEIVIVVPSGVTTGNVTVSTNAGGSSNGVLFTVDSSSMLVSMSVDHPIASPGDSVVFGFSASNTGDTPLSVASLNNTLPAGFAFTIGSAIIQLIGANGEASVAQAITPIVGPDGLVFPIGALAARSGISIRYSAVVLSDAHPGEHRSGVTGIANVLSGKRVNSSPAQVRVTVTAGAFSLNQVLIGRVFEDRNTNGSYDSGEPGVANVRVVSSSGQTATTDSDGQYNLPNVAAGTLLVAVDPSTLPPGLDLPPKESRLGGAGRLLRTPLEGGGLLTQNFALIRVAGSSPASSATPSPRRHEDARDGGEAVRLEMVIERPVMTAGAYDKQLIRIRALDRLDHSTDTAIVVTTATGSVMAAGNASDQFTCESVLSLDQRPDVSRQVELDTVDGEAAICLVSDIVPSSSRLVATTGDRHVSATADMRFEAVRRPPLLVAVGEIGIGLSGPGKNATDGARRVDGLASIFYQNSVSKKDLLTVAVRSKGTVNSAAGNEGLFGFDPTQRFYAVMGDASTHQELGQSASRVYARYDRGQSFVMFGDLHGDTAAEGRSGLLEYNRNVTGFRFQLQTANPTNWFQGQVARPKTGYMRDISSAMAGSAIRLSQIQILPGSETITLEVRDRRNPERILSRETLVRNVDYSLDPLSGTLFMMRPVSLFDSSLNLVQLVSTYEYQTTGSNSAMVLGRGSYSVNRIGLRLGVSMLSQDEGGENFSIGGLELEQKLLRGGRFKAEIPVSNGRLLTDTIQASSVNRNGKAIRAEFEQPLGLRDTILRGRYAKTDEGFFNPYGSITVQGQESRGISVETRALDSGRLSFGVEQEINRNRAVDNQRKTVSAKLTQALAENLLLETGIDHRSFEDHTTGQQIDSELISAGLKWKPLSRLEASIRREQNLREADPTYPSQTLLGVQYQLTASNRIFATQRFSSAPITPIGGAENSGVLSPQSTRETAIGVESRLLKNTNLTTNYRMDTSGTGTDSFAVLGVLTRLPIRPGLSFDWTLDNAVHLAGTGKGYVGGSFGFTQSKDDKLRISSRFEMRRADTTQKIFTAGIVGRLSTSTSAMARYRVSNYATGGAGRLNDGLLALAVRPKKSDRVALLFSYEFGNGNAAAIPTGVASLSRTDRLSADGLVRIGHGFEFYSRVAEARTSSVYGGSRLGTYLQGRLQKSLSHRFDVAGETRWIRESVIAKGALIIGAEWGTWLTQDFRVGLGYSSRGFANPGALLNSTAARGGPYVVLTSSLSSIFDLMGSSGKSK